MNCGENSSGEQHRSVLHRFVRDRLNVVLLDMDIGDGPKQLFFRGLFRFAHFV